MTEPIQWVEETRRLEELVPFERNPRQITESQFCKLKASLIEFGQFRPLLVTHDLRLAGGHQRITAMKLLGWTHCRVSIPQQPITAELYRKLVIVDNISHGTFDMDILANDYDLEETREWGLQDIFDIPPMGAEEDNGSGGITVKCPKCEHCFPLRGNRA